MDPGRLDIGLRCTAGLVAQVAIASSRPQAAAVLHGLPVAQAVALLPRLYALCGQAQGVAAATARSAAEDGNCQQQQDPAVAAEAAQEHLWRLLIDWPRELGLTPSIAAFAHWRRALAGGGLSGAAFLDFLGNDLFGMKPDVWLARIALEDFSDWCAGSPALAARICRQLAADDHGPVVFQKPVQLKAFDPVAAMSDWPELTPAFSERPLWHGMPAETGAYSRRHQDPLISALTPRPLLARVVARLQELTALAVNDFALSLPGATAALPFGRGTGRALVETARGLLMHELTLEGGKVARYVIVAPTEWNFHPAGALPSLLVGQSVATAEQAAMLARRAVLVLDPCVAHEINVSWQS